MDSALIIKIVYAAASIQGLFLCVLLARTKTNQPANRILALLLLLLSFHLILVGFDERAFFMTFPHLSKISWIIGTLYGPLLYVFIQHLTGHRPSSEWKNSWLLIPFMVVLASLLPYFAQSAEFKRAYLDDFEKASMDDFGWVNQFVSVCHIGFQFLCFWLYRIIEKEKSSEYAALESVRIKWLSDFLKLMLAAVLVGVIPFFARTWGIPFLSGFYHYHFIGVVALFYWLSVRALTNPVIFGIYQSGAEGKEPASGTKYQKSTLTHAELDSHFNAVVSTLERSKLFLKKDLTLSDLAEATHLSKHQVSQAISHSGRGNFFDLVNEFRIEEFKMKAVSPEFGHLNLAGIAQECGFNSKASFYAVFKRKAGSTPLEFLKNRSASTAA